MSHLDIYIHNIFVAKSENVTFCTCLTADTQMHIKYKSWTTNRSVQ